MSIIANNLLQGDEGYNLDRSLRFRSSASAYLTRTPSVTGNRRTWTASLWFKRGTLGVAQILLGATGSSRATYINLNASNQLQIYSATSAGGGDGGEYITTQLFRDPSAWYHLVIAYDSTQATSTNRIKLWVNGQQVTAWATSTAPTLNHDSQFNWTGAAMDICRYSTSFYVDGYLAEVNFIDGQALTQSSFGETDVLTGVWKSKKYAGTYGTNGFYLPFSDNASTTTLGYDFSGNSNNCTTNNISLTAGITYDSMTDVPTLTSATAANYAVWNPLENVNTTYLGFSNGNLRASMGTGVTTCCWATMVFPMDNIYYEITVTTVSNGSVVGISYGRNTYADGTSKSIGYVFTGDKVVFGTSSAYGSTYTSGDVIGIAVNKSAGTVTFYKNNVSQGAITNANITTQPFRPFLQNATSSGTQVINANFGQRPFSYTPPTGFVALNTFNLPEPSIKAGNKQMDVTTYTGNGTAGRVITMSNMTNVGFAWVKLRSGSDDHRLANTVTGGNRHLKSNATDAESTGTNVIQAFSGNTFTVGSDNSVNLNGSTYVGWTWANGGAAVTNTAGSISAQVSANTTSGFSVVTYTGTGSAGTIGHGLGVAPRMIIVKNRVDGSTLWSVYHASVGAGSVAHLNSTAAFSASGDWNSTTPTSSVYSVNNSSRTNASGQGMVAYCFAQIAGYSAFGSYTGNGSADGTFVYLGFRPRFVMIKRIDSIANWTIRDTARRDYNSNPLGLFSNLSIAEDSTSGREVDMLSNGFKIRGTDSDLNTSSGTYIYMAFAENPFKNSLAR